MVGTRGSSAQAGASGIPKSTTMTEKETKEDVEDSKVLDGKDSAATGQPLGPPPRPSQASNGDRPDYFATPSSNTYQTETNPFDVQFANGSDPPGKLPPVAALASPSSLLPSDTSGWNSSLRSGPLSPAMLAGPASTDYFDQGLRGFPTPNESSLRTGLTPGGGGSMFPAASPGTQAMFTLSNINTPSTIDFLRTSLKNSRPNVINHAPRSQPVGESTAPSIDLRLPNATAGPYDTFGNDADAASSLFLLAQNGSRSNGFSAATKPTAGTAVAEAVLANGHSRPQSHKSSIGSLLSTDDGSDSNQSEMAAKTTSRSRNSKATTDKPKSRRKASDLNGKAPPAKRSRSSINIDKMSSSSQDDMPIQESKKGLTEEDKRKNFLERNRVAALKCRQRKKQWLQNLQQKVDIYGQENEALTNHVNQLREQIYQLKNLLIAHRDCPNLANDPRLLNAIQDPMSAVSAFVPGTGSNVQQMSMMHVTDGGPVMPRS